MLEWKVCNMMTQHFDHVSSCAHYTSRRMFKSSPNNFFFSMNFIACKACLHLSLYIDKWLFDGNPENIDHYLSRTSWSLPLSSSPEPFPSGRDPFLLARLFAAISKASKGRETREENEKKKKANTIGVSKEVCSVWIHWETITSSDVFRLRTLWW